jgi:asparagine synthase (glutamine-hydrolysing)
MSGLAGLWNLDGRPADCSVLSGLACAVAHRGPDASGQWVSGSVGFACHLLRVTPESAAESQPVSDRDGDVLVFDGRLDNREELLKAIADAGVTADSPDSALVVAAWRIWGDAFPARLHGDFALALFDSHRQTLFLARDPVGCCRPLYYWSDGKTFVFASEIKGILAHADVRRRPNQELIADFLLLNRLPYDDDGATFFQDVYAVRPGHCVRVTSKHTRSEPFWDFDPCLQLRYRSYPDYAERLRELLIEAVRRRVRTTRRVAVSASGGLDSSVVLCIADDLHRAGIVKAPILALSYGVGERADEAVFLVLLASVRHLSVERTGMEPPGAAAELTREAWHSEWPRLDDAWRAQRPLLATACAQGARVLLTGHWSDQLFFVTGYLSDLVVRLAWRQVAAHIGEYATWFPDADPSYFRSRFGRELLVNLTPHPLRRRLRPLLGGVIRGHGRSNGGAELAGLVRRPRPAVRRPRCATAHARDIYQAVRAKAHRLQFEADTKRAAGYEIESVTPFLDRDVIAFLMSIPGEMQTHNGVPRALLRDAMRGIVPDAILRRRWRAGPAASAATPDALSPEFIGLEFWSRAFFSDTLTAPQPSAKGACESMNTPDRPRKDGDERLPYSAPKLTVHGDLRTITTAKASDRTEAGQPKTFSQSMP